MLNNTKDGRVAFGRPAQKLPIITAQLLSSLRDAETAMCQAMKHGVWAEPHGIRERHCSLNVSLDLIEDHVASIRTIINPPLLQSPCDGGRADAE